MQFQARAMNGFLLAAVAATTTSLLFATPATAGLAFQSGPHAGAVYAAGIIADPRDPSQFYLTGITYDNNGVELVTSKCFVASLLMENGDGDLPMTVYATDTSVTEACRALAVLSNQQLVVVGNSDPNGLYYGDADTAQVGFGMTVSRQLPDLAAITGKSLLSESEVPYPQAVVVDPNDNDTVYIASMVSQQATENANSRDYPNWTHQYKHGTTFEMTVERFAYEATSSGSTFDGILDGIGDLQSGGSSTPTLENVWTSYFPIDPLNDGGGGGGTTPPSVFVGGMIWKEGVGLIVAGSTAAKGPAYGPATGTDEDGFITILNPETGELVQPSESTPKNNQRFGTGEFDIVTSICDDPNDPKAFYIVGATRGDIDGIEDGDLAIIEGSLQAFVKKINIDTLYDFWTYQHGAQLGTLTTETTALGCVVDGDVVYVGGVVSADAGMVNGQTVHPSSGGDDVWVAQYNGDDGAINWMQQLGSDGDDRMARGGGIVVDENGDVVVIGDTTGALYRDRTVDTASDLFGVTMARVDGSFPPTIGGDVPAPPPVTDDGSGIIPGSNQDIPDPEDIPIDAVIQASKQFHQSGPNPGALYASGIVFDTNTNQAIISGISYTKVNGQESSQSSCLLARIEVSSMETRQSNIIGDPDTLEACRAIALTSTNRAIVVGNADAGGMFSGDQEIQAGFGMSVDLPNLETQRGASLFSERIPYPQSVVTDGSAHIYVASMTSKEGAGSSSSSGANTQFPNWTYLNKHGTIFEMTVEKLQLPDFTSIWSQTYQVEVEQTKHSVYVGGMILKQDVLIAVGSTRAKGPAYGPAEGDDEDGFISLLDPNTGDLVQGRKSNHRIGTDEDDVVTAICDVPGEDNFVIVVGATKGTMEDAQTSVLDIPNGSLQWFVSKVNLSDLYPSWTVQGGALNSDATITTSSYALGCHVDDDIVYVAGTVEAGAGLVVGSSIQDSNGGDDVWAAQFDLLDGNRNWLRQFGSAGDDRLARGGGVSSDQFGNALIYGDTTGAMYRDRKIGTNADIFLAVLDFDDGSFGEKGTPAPVASPVAPTPQPVLPPTPAPVLPPVQQGGTTDEGTTIPDDIVAFQLGPDVGPTYAGGMTYVPGINSIYLTGATYGTFSGPGVRPTKESNCFFARVDLPKLEVIQRETYGVDVQPDACSAIDNNRHADRRNAFIIGSTQRGGLLTELAIDDTATQYGFVMDLTQQAKFEFLGGSVVGDTAVTYPIAIVSEQNRFWTVSMTSKDTSVSPDFEKVEHDEYPNFTSGGIEKYGTTYGINVEGFEISKAGDGNPFAQGAAQTFKSLWRKDLETVSKEAVYVSGMVEAGGGLVVVGSTRKDGHMDGLLTKINMQNGEFGEVAYFASGSNKNDWIMNACEDPNDPSFFYVVGATQGDLEEESNRADSDVTVHALVARIAVNDLTPTWTKQFKVRHADGGNTKAAAAAAFGCDVFGTENFLYIAGTVENGATMADSAGTQSAGRDDIFVAQLSTFDGRLNWMKQVGSNGDDRVARGGGISVDANGNAIVFGDSSGDFFRDRRNDANPRFADPFLMIFDKQYGIHQSPLVGPVQSDASSGSANGIAPSEYFNSLIKGEKGSGARTFGIIALVVVLLVGTYCVYRRCRNRRNMKEANPLMYDASAADTSFHEDAGSSNNGGVGSGLGMFRANSKNMDTSGPNLGYRDDPEDGGEGGLVGNFHKTYSDLPQKSVGFQII